jgi:hypothetical protein
MNLRRRWLRTLPLGALAAAGGATARSPLAGTPFSFALIGDLPYSEADEPRLAALLRDTDAEPLAFVLHVGDIKGSREPCTDALLARRRDLLAGSRHPMIVLPGDNEWTDCHRRSAGGYDPRERLAALRRLFWSGPTALGAGDRRSIVLERQPGYPENVRWQVGAVRFVGLHVVGSRNGLDGYPGSREEFVARRDANRDWLDAAVRLAVSERAAALAIGFQANPDFDRRPGPGFADFIASLQEAARIFPRPILLMHGDTHRFRNDRPLADREGRRIPHVERVECFGWPTTGSWVRIDWDPGTQAGFRVSVREVRRAPTVGA